RDQPLLLGSNCLARGIVEINCYEQAHSVQSSDPRRAKKACHGDTETQSYRARALAKTVRVTFGGAGLKSKPAPRFAGPRRTQSARLCVSVSRWLLFDCARALLSVGPAASAAACSSRLASPGTSPSPGRRKTETCAPIVRHRRAPQCRRSR